MLSAVLDNKNKTLNTMKILSYSGAPKSLRLRRLPEHGNKPLPSGMRIACTRRTPMPKLMNIRDCYGHGCPLGLEIPMGGPMNPPLNPASQAAAQAAA
jgi:hypothetical protein